MIAASKEVDDGIMIGRIPDGDWATMQLLDAGTGRRTGTLSTANHQHLPRSSRRFEEVYVRIERFNAIEFSPNGKWLVAAANDVILYWFGTLPARS